MIPIETILKTYPISTGGAGGGSSTASFGGNGGKGGFGSGGGGGVDEDVPTISVPQFEVLSEGFYRCSCGKLLSQGYSTCPSCERQLK